MRTSAVVFALGFAALHLVAAQDCDSDQIGNGWCDASSNNLECDYDGGDCCVETCSCDVTRRIEFINTEDNEEYVDLQLPCYECGSGGFNCVNQLLASTDNKEQYSGAEEVGNQQYSLENAQYFLDMLQEGNTVNFADGIETTEAVEYCPTVTINQAALPTSCLTSLSTDVELPFFNDRQVYTTNDSYLCGGNFLIDFNVNNVRAVTLSFERPPNVNFDQEFNASADPSVAWRYFAESSFSTYLFNVNRLRADQQFLNGRGFDIPQTEILATNVSFALNPDFEEEEADDYAERRLRELGLLRDTDDVVVVARKASSIRSIGIGNSCLRSITFHVGSPIDSSEWLARSNDMNAAEGRLESARSLTNEESAASKSSAAATMGLVIAATAVALATVG